MAILERASKAAASASVFLIVVFQLAVHPDITPFLQGLGVAALLVGWFASSAPGARVFVLWGALAPLAPAVLHRLTGLEGEVLDLVWLAGLAGSLLRANSWSRWNLPIVWRVLLGAWALTLSLAWPILVARETGFDPQGLRDFGAINSWAGRSAPHVVAWITYVVVTQLIGLLWLDWLIGVWPVQPASALRATAVHRSLGEGGKDRPYTGETADAPAATRLPRVVHGLWIGASAASLVAIYQGTIDLSFLNTLFWADLGRASATLLDPNPFGVVAALAGPVGFMVLRSYDTPRAHAMAIGVVAVSFLGIWMSGSRTALLCGVVGAISLGVAILWRAQSSRVRFGVAALAAALVAAIVLAASAVGPWQRLIDVPLTREGVSLLWNRGPYGPIAVRMVEDFPLTGVGTGSYHVLAADYWRVTAGNLLPWDNAQNWWRHQVAELGLLGSLPIIVWSLLIAWQVVASPIRSERPEGILVRGLLLGLGLASLLGMPTQNPVVLLWFFFLVAWLAQLRGDRVTASGAAGRWIEVAAILAAATSIGYAAGLLSTSSGPLAVAERAKRVNRDYVTGAYPLEQLPDGSLFRWTGTHAHFVLPARTPWLVLRIWTDHPDAESRPVRVTITTACQTLFEREMRSAEPFRVGLELPPNSPAADFRVQVSRTWRPSAHGVEDTRELGAGIVADFAPSREQGLAQNLVAELKACP